MTTSPNPLGINWVQIATDALTEMGVLYDGETMTPAMQNRAQRALNMMIRNWQARGIGLWLNTFDVLELVVGKQVYKIGPTFDLDIPLPLDVTEARYQAPGGDETTMSRISREEYVGLSLKSSQGTPSQYYIDRQYGYLNMYIWQTSALAYAAGAQINLTVRSPIQTFSSVSDTPYFPDEWYEPIMYNLAIRMAPGFKLLPNVYQQLMVLAADTLQSADGFDREQTSVYFAPEFRGYR